MAQALTTEETRLVAETIRAITEMPGSDADSADWHYWMCGPGHRPGDCSLACDVNPLRLLIYGSHVTDRHELRASDTIPCPAPAMSSSNALASARLACSSANLRAARILRDR